MKRNTNRSTSRLPARSWALGAGVPGGCAVLHVAGLPRRVTAGAVALRMLEGALAVVYDAQQRGLMAGPPLPPPRTPASVLWASEPPDPTREPIPCAPGAAGGWLVVADAGALRALLVGDPRLATEALLALIRGLSAGELTPARGGLRMHAALWVSPAGGGDA